MKYRFARFADAGVAVALWAGAFDAATLGAESRPIDDVNPRRAAEQTALNLAASTLSNQLRPTHEGNRLVEAAAAAMGTHETAQASFKSRTELLGQSLSGTGSYAQLRSSRGMLVRMELTLVAPSETITDPIDSLTQIRTTPNSASGTVERATVSSSQEDATTQPAVVASVLSVCDGSDLWIHRKWGTEESLTRVDLQTIDRVVQAPANAPQKGAFPASPTSAGLPSSLVSGGLPRLFHQLLAHFDFTTSPQTTILNGIDVWQVTGTWREETLATLLPQQEKLLRETNGFDWNQTPAHLPQFVVLSLRTQDLFPIEIRFERRDSPTQAKRATMPTPKAAIPHSAFVFGFSNVELAGPMDAAKFDYRPGALNVVDNTAQFLRKTTTAQSRSDSHSRLR